MYFYIVSWMFGAELVRLMRFDIWNRVHHDCLLILSFLTQIRLKILFFLCFSMHLHVAQWEVYSCNSIQNWCGNVNISEKRQGRHGSKRLCATHGRFVLPNNSHSRAFHSHVNAHFLYLFLGGNGYGIYPNRKESYFSM